MNTLSALIDTTTETLANCRVRLASDADEAALKNFLRQQRTSIQNLITSDPDGDLNGIEAFYNNRDGFILVLEIDGQVVGTIALFAVDEFRCEIRKFYLAPALSSNGLGRKLLSTVLRIAEARGFRTVQVETSAKLIAAYALYAKFGFRPGKSVGSPHLINGHVLERSLVSAEEIERAC